MPNYWVRFKGESLITLIRCMGFETVGQAVDYAVRKSGINEKYLDGVEKYLDRVEVQEEAAATPEPTSPTESSRVKFKLDNGREVEAYLRVHGDYIYLTVNSHSSSKCQVIFSLLSSGFGYRHTFVRMPGIQTDANGRIKLNE
jgi:hypothetical protein